MERILKTLALMVLVIFCFGPQEVHAAQSSLTLCGACDDDDNLLECSPGIPVDLNGEKYIIASEDLYMEDCENYIFVSGDTSVPMEYMGTLFGMPAFRASGDESLTYLTPDLAAIGESASLVGFNPDLEMFSVRVTITGYEPLDSSGGYQLSAQFEEEFDSYVTPAAIVNSNGNVIALVNDEGISCAFGEPQSGEGNSGNPDENEPESESDGSSDEQPSRPARPVQDSETENKEQTDDKDDGIEKTDGFQANNLIPIIGIAAVLVVAVGIAVFVSRKNKKPAQPSASASNLSYGNTAPVDRVPEHAAQQAFSGQETRAVWEDAPKAEIQLYLVGIGGCMNGQEYRISDHKITIGRAVGSSICYPAETKGISRQHCQIFWKNGVLMIMDLGSTSGTFFRGKGQLQPNVPVVLKEGDVIYLGSKQNAFTVRVK